MQTSPLQHALAFQQGSEKAFEYFFKLLRPRLEYYAFRILDDKDEAADVVEESFIKIWGTHQIFDHPKVIKAWLYTTVRNASVNLVHSKRRYRNVEKDLTILSTPDFEESKENQIIRAETLGLLHEGIKQMPSELKKIFIMLYISGKTVREVSEELDLTISTVKNQKRRGLGLLKEFSETGTWKENPHTIGHGRDLPEYYKIGFAVLATNFEITLEKLAKIIGKSKDSAGRMKRRFLTLNNTP